MTFLCKPNLVPELNFLLVSLRNIVWSPSKREKWNWEVAFCAGRLIFPFQLPGPWIRYSRPPQTCWTLTSLTQMSLRGDFASLKQPSKIHHSVKGNRRSMVRTSTEPQENNPKLGPGSRKLVWVKVWGLLNQYTVTCVGVVLFINIDPLRITNLPAPRIMRNWEIHCPVSWGSQPPGLEMWSQRREEERKPSWPSDTGSGQNPLVLPACKLFSPSSPKIHTQSPAWYHYLLYQVIFTRNHTFDMSYAIGWGKTSQASGWQGSSTTESTSPQVWRPKCDSWNRANRDN